MKLNVAYLALGLTMAGQLTSAVPLPRDESFASRDLQVDRRDEHDHERTRVFNPHVFLKPDVKRSEDDADIAEYARDMIESRGWLPAITGGAKLVAAGIGSGIVGGAIGKASDWLAKKIRGRDVHEMLSRGEPYYAERGDRGAFILPGKRAGEAIFVPTKRSDAPSGPDVVPSKRYAGQVFFVPGKRSTVDIPVVAGRDYGSVDSPGKRNAVDIPIVPSRRDGSAGGDAGGGGGVADKRRVVDIPIVAGRQYGSAGSSGKRDSVDIPIGPNRRGGGGEGRDPYDTAISKKRGTTGIPEMSGRAAVSGERPPDFKNHPETAARSIEEARGFSLGKVLKILIRDGDGSLDTRGFDPSAVRASFIPVNGRGVVDAKRDNLSDEPLRGNRRLGVRKFGGNNLERDNLSDEPIRGNRRLGIRAFGGNEDEEQRDNLSDSPLRGNRRLDLRGLGNDDDADDAQARGLSRIVSMGVVKRESQGGALSGSIGGRGEDGGEGNVEAQARGLLRGVMRLVFARQDDDEATQFARDVL